MVHRVFRGDDVARLLAGARAVQREHGSLGARFRRDLDAAKGEPLPVRAALAAFSSAIRQAGKLGEDAGARRGPSAPLARSARSERVEASLPFSPLDGASL